MLQGTGPPSPVPTFADRSLNNKRIVKSQAVAEAIAVDGLHFQE